MALTKGSGHLRGMGHLSFTSGSLTVSSSFQSSNFVETMDEDVTRGSNGEQIIHQLYGTTQEVDFEWVYVSGTNDGDQVVALPAAGSLITVATTKVVKQAGVWPVISSEVVEQNEKATICKAKCKRFISITYS